jgi:hypothetical protein
MMPLFFLIRYIFNGDGLGFASLLSIFLASTTYINIIFVFQDLWVKIQNPFESDTQDKVNGKEI